MSPNPEPHPPTDIAMRDLLNSRQNLRENRKRMTDKIKMNIVCDKLVGATTRDALKGGDTQGRVLLDLSYADSRTMLKIRNKWITSRYTDELYKACQTGPMREYCKKKYNWIDKIYSTRSIGSQWGAYAGNCHPQCKHIHVRSYTIGSPRVTRDNGRKRGHTAQDATNQMRSCDTYGSAPRHE